MKPPFQLPVRPAAEFARVLDDDGKLIAEISGDTPETLAYIMKIINNHDALATALLNLVEAARRELLQDDLGDAFGSALQALKDLP